MVMELMEGGELFDRIRHKISFTEKEASEITRQVLAIYWYVLRNQYVLQTFFVISAWMIYSCRHPKSIPVYTTFTLSGPPVVSSSGLMSHNYLL